MDEQAALGVPALQGSVIAGKYRVERLIGVGGMGTVWEGIHLSLGTQVAIKFIKPEFAEQPEARTRFAIEARAASRIQSKHAVQVYDYGLTDAGLPYIVMEYLKGEALSDALARRGPLPPVEAAYVIIQAAQALSKAHSVGIVHRDLKPDNIFLAETDEPAFGLPYIVKIVDFGIAKIVDNDEPIAESVRGSLPMGGPTREGTVVGTPSFMSPEQLTIGGPPSPESDIWSLGACTFTAFTARIPFEGDVLGDIVLKVCVTPLPTPSHYNPNVPPGFDAFFFRACSRDASKRFQTAVELSESLAGVCGLTGMRVATLTEDQVQYVLRPNPSYAQYDDSDDSLPTRSAMSPRTAMLAGLVLGITGMMGLLGVFAWKNGMQSDVTEPDAGVAVAPSSSVASTSTTSTAKIVDASTAVSTLSGMDAGHLHHSVKPSPSAAASTKSK